MKKYISCLRCLCLTLVTFAQFTEALPRPVLDENGRDLGLFERVVTGKNAQLVNTPGGQQVLESPGPFNSFYVFDEQQASGEVYFNVGPNSAQPPTGWIKQSQVISWSNNLTLVFNEPVDRHPVLFFTEPVGAGWLRASPHETGLRSESLVEKVRSNTASSSDGIVAMEPQKYRHWSERFYLMPVLDFVSLQQPLPSQSSSTARPDTLLKTAAIPVDGETQGGAISCSAETKIGVVFVIDTTISMQPYIDQTKSMVVELADKIIQQGLSSRVQFGLVGYRDQAAGNNNVEYRTKTYHSLDVKNDPTKFSGELDKMFAAKAATRGFSEDGLAGVLEATEMDWEPYQSKWIVLISDAGLKTPILDKQGNKRSLDTIAGMLWNEKHIGVITLHLETPEAQKANNTTSAKNQLKSLSSWASTASGYIAVKQGDVSLFSKHILTGVSNIITNLTRSNQQLSSSAASGNALAAIDLAQRLHWIGQCEDNQAPNILEGWVLDRAVGTSGANNQARFAFEPRLLLTRIQMNDLAKALSSIVDTAKSTMLTPEKFFAEIAITLGTAANDPSQINSSAYQGRLNQGNVNVQKIGDLLPGYLSRLPYLSDFLTIGPKQWSSMGTRDIRNWIDQIESTIDTLNIHYNKTETELFKLHPDASPGEWVYPVLLSDFP